MPLGYFEKLNCVVLRLIRVFYAPSWGWWTFFMPIVKSTVKLADFCAAE